MNTSDQCVANLRHCGRANPTLGDVHIMVAARPCGSARTAIKIANCDLDWRLALGFTCAWPESERSSRPLSYLTGRYISVIPLSSGTLASLKGRYRLRTWHSFCSAVAAPLALAALKNRLLTANKFL